MKLIEARAMQALSTKALAQLAGVAVMTVNHVERGKVLPRLATVRKLSKALRVQPNEIDEFREAIERTIRGRTKGGEA